MYAHDHGLKKIWVKIDQHHFDYPLHHPHHHSQMEFQSHLSSFLSSFSSPVKIHPPCFMLKMAAAEFAVTIVLDD
jgi:hypothetical protein